MSYLVVFVAALGFFVWRSRPEASRGSVALSRTVAYQSDTLQSARVLRILDADTIQVVVQDSATRRSATLTLNIHGITAAEGALAQRAKDYLESFITPGTDLAIDLKGRDGRGKPAAVFVVNGGRDAAVALLETGLAQVSVSENDSTAALYLKAQQLAQSSRSGMWK